MDMSCRHTCTNIFAGGVSVAQKTAFQCIFSEELAILASETKFNSTWLRRQTHQISAEDLAPKMCFCSADWHRSSPAWLRLSTRVLVCCSLTHTLLFQQRKIAERQLFPEALSSLQIILTRYCLLKGKH